MLRDRGRALQDLHRELLQAVPASDRSSFPTYSVFEQLPTVSAFRSTNVKLTNATWTLALPAIQIEIRKVCRALKVTYARRIVQSLETIGRPLPPPLVASLTPPGFLPATSADGTISLAGGESFDPSTTTEEELDELLSRFTSRAFWLCDSRGHRLGSPDTLWNLQSTHPCGSEGGCASADWLRILFGAVFLTSLGEFV